MNLLIDELPQSVFVDGREYAIRWDFRTSVLYELLVLNPDIPQKDKLVLALELYYPQIPHRLEEAVEAMQWFYGCGKTENALPSRRLKGRSTSQEQIYSFEHDDVYIYAAFLKQYGIDLNQAENLHWWKFRALFSSLEEGCELRKIMGYRAVNITEEMGREQKEFYRSMKELYKLPSGRNEAEKLQAIEEALLEGRDLSGLL